MTTPNTPPPFKMPPFWGVYFHADELTQFDIAYDVLLNTFNLSADVAKEVVQVADAVGVAYVGSFTKEIADTMVEIGETIGRVYESPLEFSCKVEE